MRGDVIAKMERAGIDAICDQIIDGTSYLDIAKSLGVSIAMLSAWISTNPERSARARGARIASASTFDEMASDGLKSAADPFELSKAKELAHHYRWRAAKRSPAEYSEKVQVDATVKRSAEDVTDDELLTIATGSRPGAAEQAPSEDKPTGLH